MLTEIWQNVLQIERVGVQESFFDVGGHSLLAVDLFGQIEEIFGIRLPLATLFEAPTIEQIAHAMQQENWSAPTTALVPLAVLVVCQKFRPTI